MAEFIVLGSGGQWVVCSEKGDAGPFEKQGHAIEAAIEAAQAAGSNGADARVLMLNEVSELYPIWRFGQDSYARRAGPHPAKVDPGTTAA
jgi:hypothetical protein